MKIRGLHIDGFGIFRDYRVDNIGDKLTVFFGANEAGKSTLLAFLRGVLFGFPDRRNRVNLYPPLNGGRHGGRLFLEGDDGIYTVERIAANRRSPRITRPDGSRGTEDDLRRLTGGADEKLFSNIFAFSLKELASLDSLTKEGIQERIFSAGVWGAAGPAVTEATKSLKAAQAKLLTPQGGLINELIAKLQENQQKRREAEELAGQYSEFRKREHIASEKLNALKGQIEEASRREGSLRSLLDLCPKIRSTIEKLTGQLGELGIKLPSISPDEPLTFTSAATLAPGISKAEAELKAREEALNQLRSSLVNLRSAGAQLSSIRQVALDRKDALREAKATTAGDGRAKNTAQLIPYMIWGLAGLLFAGAVWGIISANIGIALTFGMPSILAAGAAILLARLNANSALRRKEYLERLGASLAAATAELELAENSFRSIAAETKARAIALGFEDCPSWGEVEVMASHLTAQREKILACWELQHRLQEMESQARRLLYDIEATHEQATRPDENRQEELWEMEWRGLRERIENLQSEYEAAIREHRDIQRQIESLETSSSLVELSAAEEMLKSQLEDAARRWRVNALAQGLLRETLAEYERTRQPQVLRSASDFFRSITDGRYVQVVQTPGAGSFEVINQDGERLSVEALSRGTCEQLYLSVRLGLAQDFAHRAAALPLVMDDILVNFDPKRQEATARALVAVADELQVIFFTCHPETLQLFMRCAPGCHVISL